MKKILLYLSADTIDFKIDIPTCYDTLYNDYIGGGGGNAGNKLFLSATKSYLENVDLENTIYYSVLKKNFFISNKSIDEINSSYKAIVLPQANIFSNSKRERIYLSGFTETIKKLKIPVYVTGVGAQAKDYGDIYKLYYSIRNVAIEFCNAVYHTGGEFSLRGYFTKELFNMFGFKSAVVTGCPSIFQVGRNFQIIETKVKQNELKPVINGYSNFLYNNTVYSAFKRYNAIYIDQSEFIRILYDESYISEIKKSRKYIHKLIDTYTIRGLNLIADGKMKLFYDIPIWESFIVSNNFNFSFGQRIHGNLISIINGIPAVVVAHDSRTKELAEYFEIPNICNVKKYDDIYEIYQEMDYKNFNKNFSKKYDIFNKFMLEHGLRQNDIEPNKNNKIDLNNFVFPQNKNLQYVNEFKDLLKNSRYKVVEQLNMVKKNMLLLPYDIKEEFMKILYKYVYYFQESQKKGNNKID